MIENASTHVLDISTIHRSSKECLSCVRLQHEIDSILRLQSSQCARDLSFQVCNA